MRCAKRGESVRTRIKNQQDFWAGLMFIVFGLAAILISRDYPYGTAMRMGPGYFPTWIGAMLIILGAAVSAVSFKLEEGQITPFAWKPMILLSLSFVVFGFGIDHVGFVPALMGVIVLSAAAGKRCRLLEVALLTVVLVLLELGIFVYGIELPLRLFWWD
jgi:putative tricarboxylic transport membrane protein